MFQLDDKFLADVGLQDLPEDQKKAFLQHIYDELELRVGTKLSDGMSDEQLEEFESIIDRKDDVVTAWLAQHAPDYHNEEAFSRVQQATGLDVNDPGLRAEYAATKWLEVNRPDYRQVVSSVLDELKKEIAGNKDTLLASDQPAV
jgi:hypothetical protein